MENNNGRSVNILLAIAGVLCCIGSGFVTAPKGLLADESASIVQTLQLPQLAMFFAVPSVLMLLACVLVVIGKMDILSICSVLAGGVLFAMMDFQFGMSHQTFSGILINMVGVILVVAAVALQVFATETGPAKVSRKAAKSRNPKEFRYERSRRPAYDDIYMDISGSGHSTAKAADTVAADDDEYGALDSLKALEAEAEEIEAAQKAQEDEIEAMLKALSLDAEAEPPKKAETVEAEVSESEPAAASVEEALAVFDDGLDSESEALLKEMEAEAKQAAEELNLNMPTVSSSTAMAHMAEALETPNQTMTDFYEGIEEIFLDQGDQ